MKTYDDFIAQKSQIGTNDGFKANWIPDFLFDFQKFLLDWNLFKGKSATYADCGLGKTPLQLCWSENIVRKTNGRVLILTPLAVRHQTATEARKFGIEAEPCSDGKLNGAKIVITNYERLHYFNSEDFAGVVCDESGILKNFDGATKAAITHFMRKTRYRLLCTATPAPNDFIELGTSSEALGELGFMDMLGRFFKKQETACTRSDELRHGMWRFRGHAETHFWRWVCSWARAIRKPSDFGFDDSLFNLPPLIIDEHTVSARTKNANFLFDLPAMGLREQCDERRRTIQERCEQAAKLVCQHDGQAVLWCNLNDEGKLLNDLTPDSEEIAGSQSDERKEELLVAFQSGQLKRLVTKSSITGWGCNWQNCAHETFFPSHSFEQWYQAVRRCWRFGQKHAVQVDIISSEGERGILNNLKRKAEASERMFTNLIELMNKELKIERKTLQKTTTNIPLWLSPKS